MKLQRLSGTLNARLIYSLVCLHSQTFVRNSSDPIHNEECTVKCSKKLSGVEDSFVRLAIASTLQMS